MAKTTTVNRSDRSGGLQNSSIHLRRYIRHKLGKTTAEIAEADGVREETVKHSIANVDAYRETNTVEYLNQSVISVVMDNAQNMKHALGDGLTATTRDDKGKKVPDHMVRAKFMETAAKIIQTVQPKAAPNFSVKVNQQTGVMHANSTPVAESGFVGYEERLRMIRRKIDQHNLLPPVTGDVTDHDSELEDEGESPEVVVDAGNTNPQG